MHYRFLCAGLLASAVAGAGVAVAADFAVRPAPTAAAPIASPPPYISEWAGFYVGIHGGGGWAHESLELSEFDNVGFCNGMCVTPPNTSASGGIFGFQAGHNWQWGSVVGGLEIDFSGADIRETTTFIAPFQPATATHNFKIDELASARFRLGYLISPNLLAFGTAGIGWGHFKFSTTATDAFGDFASVAEENNEFGWVAGAGLEWKFASNWLLRGEWLHYDFARVTNPNNSDALNTGFFLIDNGNSRVTVDVARAALSYKF
jgi:outer membrane immunogenic protein